MSPLQIFPIPGLPLVRPGDDLAGLLLSALVALPQGLADDDVVVVCQKVVSKAEGRVVLLSEMVPSIFAESIATTTGKDPRVVEVVLRQSRRIVRMDGGHLIVETGPGWVCANAGVDESNSVGGDTVVLLPLDPDASARRLRDAVARDTGRRVAVIVTDTFGRPWRDGLIEFARGAAGIEPLLDFRGRRDLNDRELHHTVVAQVDALAAVAGLLMRKGDGIPAVLVRGYSFNRSDAGATTLIRPREMDLFR